jgi:hypothetical protein
MLLETAAPDLKAGITNEGLADCLGRYELLMALPLCTLDSRIWVSILGIGRVKNVVVAGGENDDGGVKIPRSDTGVMVSSRLGAVANRDSPPSLVSLARIFIIA